LQHFSLFLGRTNWDPRYSLGDRFCSTGSFHHPLCLLLCVKLLLIAPWTSYGMLHESMKKNRMF